MATDEAPIKVSRVTKERIRLISAFEGRTHADFTEQAVDEFIERHKPELAAGLVSAGSTLGIPIKLGD